MNQKKGSISSEFQKEARFFLEQSEGIDFFDSQRRALSGKPERQSCFAETQNVVRKAEGNPVLLKRGALSGSRKAILFY